MILFSGSRTPIWNTGVSRDPATGKETRRTAHDYRNTRVGNGRLWVCQNCKAVKP